MGATKIKLDAYAKLANIFLEDLVKLTPHEIGMLVDLLAGTLSEYDLSTSVAESTGDELYVEWVGTGKPLKQTIHELITKMESVGATPLFLAEVYRRRSKRNDVRQAIAILYPEIIGLAAQTPPEFDMQLRGSRVTTDTPSGAFAPGLQRNIKEHLSLLDIGTWGLKLATIQRCVCRVEIGETAAGTGFLVGPATVITNWHVVERAVSDGNISDLACHFDYTDTLSGGRIRGCGCQLMAQLYGIVHTRQPSLRRRLRATAAVKPNSILRLSN